MIALRLLPILLLTMAATATAQESAQLPAWRTYGTQKRMTELRTANPEMAETSISTEQFTTSFIHHSRIDTVVVPVVVHLLPLPNGATLSAAAVQTGLDRLNIDFFTPVHPYITTSYQDPGLLTDIFGAITGTDADNQIYIHPADRREHFAEAAGLPAIRFCLASFDPNGQSTNGIVQVAGTAQQWATNGTTLQSTTAGGSDAWDTKRYCNIWIAELKDSTCGYAQMPGGPWVTDGIVIDHRYWANSGKISQYGTSITQPATDGTLPPPNGENPYWLGRTLVHLMGSYLNLYELWNETTPCTDDYVEDTPIHNAPNGRFWQYRHVSTCDGNPVEMTMNLMDNTDDDGQYLFTWGQVMRMQAILAEGGLRYGLRATATNCAADGVTENSDRSAPAATTDMAVKVFPNPTKNGFTIDIHLTEPTQSAENLSVTIYNITGSAVWQQSISQPVLNLRFFVDGSNWPQGIYTAHIHCGRQDQWVKVIRD
jgi:Secretion system C-terminal sorting domain/Pregnancy-associated plasma protein-A